jgi:pimeloyl-ACP methyl ester carboxylesterase
MTAPFPPFASGHTPGAGPLLVYLHGLGCAGSRDWPPVANSPALSGRASLWVDLLGFGLSPRPETFSYDLDDQAQALLPLLAQSSDAFALVGHSMGGTLAVLLAERLISAGRHPEAVILAEPNLRAAEATSSAKAARTPLPNFLRGWEAWQASLSSSWYRQSVALADPVAYHRSAVSLVAHSARLLPRFTGLPVERKGYLHGSRSTGETLETARQVAAAGVRGAVVEGSGHDFSADNPSGFAEAIAKLLNG